MIALRVGRAGDAARRATGLFALTALQATIGIATLLLMVPISAALLHQAAAILLLIMAVVNAEAVSRSPRPSEQGRAVSTMRAA
jgi:cytochrome c oxidase assembly protein subunit 15